MKRELLFSVGKKDLKIDYFSGKGAGGQHRNKHQNCVRLHHPDSGAISTGQSHRERQANLKEALHGLVGTPRFRAWRNQMVQESISGESIEAVVERQMMPNNLLIESREDGKWVKCPIP